MDPFVIELIGYLGCVLVVVAMLMTSVVKLRIISLIGSVVSLVYALIISALPTSLMNIALILINAWNLRRMAKSSPAYHLEIGTADDAMVKLFLRKYGEDIKKYFGNFAGAHEGQTAYITMSDDQVVGLMLGKETDGVVEFTLDYTTPAFRDASPAAFLYKTLAAANVKRLVLTEEPTGHKGFLGKMGFVAENGVYTKSL